MSFQIFTALIYAEHALKSRSGFFSKTRTITSLERGFLILLIHHMDRKLGPFVFKLTFFLLQTDSFCILVYEIFTCSVATWQTVDQQKGFPIVSGLSRTLKFHVFSRNHLTWHQPCLKAEITLYVAF